MCYSDNLKYLTDLFLLFINMQEQNKTTLWKIVYDTARRLSESFGNPARWRICWEKFEISVNYFASHIQNFDM